MSDIELGADVVGGMDWKRVTSSNLHSLAWHEDCLFVRFEGGRVYRYECGRAVYDHLLEANVDPERSVGRTFHRTVKSADIEFARVKITEPE